jgi:hypothetical protein
MCVARDTLASEASFFGVSTGFLLDFFFFFFLFVTDSPLAAGDAPRGGREGGGVAGLSHGMWALQKIPNN